MELRIIIFSSVLNRIQDEGVKNFSRDLGLEWQKQGHSLLWANLGRESSPEKDFIDVDPWLIPWNLPAQVKYFSPDLVVYFPDASLNIFSSLRSRVMHMIFPRAKLAMIALQPEKNPVNQLFWIRLVKSFDRLFVQSQHSKEVYKCISKFISVIPSGVDKNKFHSVDLENKNCFRQKYGIQSDLPIVLHVGHIKKSRNIEKLLPVQKDGIAQLILIGSTSTIQDESIVQEFKEAGSIVVDHYLEHIEEWYQMADLYVFPVVSPKDAIEFPLSVLEALACGLSVVSTPFGGLPDFLSEKDGVFFVSDGDLKKGIIKLINNPISVPALSSNFDWSLISRKIILDSGFSV